MVTISWKSRYMAQGLYMETDKNEDIILVLTYQRKINNRRLFIDGNITLILPTT
jgi:hypothetical protein